MFVIVKLHKFHTRTYALMWRCDCALPPY